MELSPLPDISGEKVLSELREVIRLLENVRGSGGDYSTIFKNYVGWVADAVRILTHVVHREDVSRLITTPRHWALVTMTHTISSNVLSLTNTEIEERYFELGKVRDSLDAQLRRWLGFSGDVFIPDANVYLHSDLFFAELGWRQILDDRPLTELRLVIPILVIEELDRAKRRTDKVSDKNPEAVRTRARRTLKRINESFSEPSDNPILVQSTGDCAAITMSLLIDEITHSRLPDADNEILDRALSLQDISGKKITIITRDHTMALKARNIGLKSKLLEDE